jgi:hypothetical protein
MAPQTMKAVVFDGPHKVSLQDRPLPVIIDQTDIIVAVTYTALCGSELHVFRGHQPVCFPFYFPFEVVRNLEGSIKSLRHAANRVSGVESYGFHYGP